MRASHTLITGVMLLAACAVAIRTLGADSPALENVVLSGCVLMDVAVMIATLRSHPRTAWSLTLASVICCLGLFAVIRPSLV